MKDKKRRADSLPGIPLETLPVRRGDLRGGVVYRALLEAIKSGKLKPGNRVREEEIARSLGVSRTPVREALQLLQARRLIELVPGRGLVVVELNMHQVMELYAMREVLEGASARFAAQHALPGEIAVMRQLLDAFTAAKGNPKKLEQVNIALHRAIYEAARNRYMHEALNNLGDALSLLGRTTFTLPERHESADREHRAIVAAIDAHDSDKAEAVSRLHIREAQRARLSLLASV
jgi:DNA-binding GntR family transcriptional regulator